MQNPTTIELGDNDSIVITKDGKVVGYVQVKRERANAIELVANPVGLINNWFMPDALRISHCFATTSATNVDSLDDLSSSENFINFMNKKSVA